VKPLAQVVLAVVLAGLQAALLRWLGGGAFSVSLLAPCLVYVGLHSGNVDGALAAAGIGFVLDVLAGTPKGLLTSLGVAVFLVARAAAAAVDIRGRSGFAVLSGLAALGLSSGALLLARYTALPEAAPGLTLLPRMLGEALLTGIVSLAVLPGMRRLDGLFHREEPGLLR
jgi:hypothetical protein